MNLISLTRDYFDDILVRLAHHSAGLEGNSISLPATVSIIVNGTLPTSSGATVREFYEIENHKQAFERMASHLINEELLFVTIIKEIHADLTDRLQYDKGQFKKIKNIIIGAEFQTASPAETSDDKLLAILDTHIQFERIHPFSDGNGRTGRMIMNYSLLQEGFPPLIIEKEAKAQYVELLATQDVDSFLSFATKTLEKESKRMIAFQSMDQEKIKEIE